MAATEFAQILGFVSFILGISAVYQKNDRYLKIMMLALNLNHMLHYFLLGSMVSALSSLLSAFRTTLSIYTASRIAAWIFIAIALVSGAWLAENWWDLWAVAGTVIGTYSIFVLSGIKMRIGFLLGACCWLTNNIIVGSIGGAMLELSMIGMNLVTIYRLYSDEQDLALEQA